MLLINEQRLTSLPQEIIDNFIETKNNLLNVENISITNNTSSIKAIVGANNYVSFAVYWHPNPDTPTVRLTKNLFTYKKFVLFDFALLFYKIRSLCTKSY